MSRTPNCQNERPFHSFTFEPLSSQHSRSHGFALLSPPSERPAHAWSLKMAKTNPLSHHWVLRGEVSAKSFSTFSEAALDAMTSQENLSTGYSFLETSTVFPFLIIVHQVSEHQHRFLLLLRDPQVQAFLKALMSQGGDHERVGFEFVNRDDSSGVVLQMRSQMLPSDIPADLELAGMAGNGPAQECTAIPLGDLATVIALAGHPDLVPSLCSDAVTRHISVSILLPTQLT